MCQRCITGAKGVQRRCGCGAGIRYSPTSTFSTNRPRFFDNPRSPCYTIRAPRSTVEHHHRDPRALQQHRCFPRSLDRHRLCPPKAGAGRTVGRLRMVRSCRPEPPPEHSRGHSGAHPVVVQLLDRPRTHRPPARSLKKPIS